MFEKILTLVMMVYNSEYCKATIFGYEDDPHAGGEAVCVYRNVRDTELGIAHRTLPCGTRVYLFNPANKTGSFAKVIDRGPYGAIFLNKWFVKKNSKSPGIWRGCVDMTSALAKKISHDGESKVLLLVP